MSSKAQILTEFKRHLVMFLDELIETFPKETDFITLRILVKDQIPASIIMDAFVEDIDHVEQQVHAMDPKFFTDGNVIFKRLDREKQFVKVWEESSHDNRDVMWVWFKQFTLFVRKYNALS